MMDALMHVGIDLRPALTFSLFEPLLTKGLHVSKHRLQRKPQPTRGRFGKTHLLKGVRP